MKKYEITKNTVSVPYKKRSEICQGFSTNYSDFLEPEIIVSFNSLEEARSELTKYQTVINKTNSNTGIFYDVIEYAIVENEYNSENEWIGGGDIWDFSKMEIKVIDVDNNYNILKEFDNFNEAEEFIENHIDNETYYNIKIEF